MLTEGVETNVTGSGSESFLTEPDPPPGGAAVISTLLVLVNGDTSSLPGVEEVLDDDEVVPLLASSCCCCSCRWSPTAFPLLFTPPVPFPSVLLGSPFEATIRLFIGGFGSWTM